MQKYCSKSGAYEYPERNEFKDDYIPFPDIKDRERSLDRSPGSSLKKQHMQL
jgi:hypothetical protein